MALKQINLTLPEKLVKAAKGYADKYGYRNVQELATESIREKIFDSDYDEEFSEAEIDLIDNILALSIKKKDMISEKELIKLLG